MRNIKTLLVSLILFSVFGFQLQEVKAQTPVPICGQLNSFTGMTRGYWFVSPVTFTICGIWVADNMSTAAQSVAIVRFNNATPPPAWPGTTNAFVQLFLQQNHVPNAMIPCNVAVSAGDVIGVYGSRGNAINSYGNPNCPTTIMGQPTTLVRSGFQFNLAGMPPANIWTEAWYNIGRVVIYYNCCPPPPAIPNMNGPTTVCEGSTHTYSVPAMPAAVTYNWTVPGGATIQSGQGTNTISVLWGATGGNICVTYNDTCTVSPQFCMPVTVDPMPTPANAGPDQFICGSMATLAGNVPGVGTGQWNMLFGGGTVTNPTLNNSTVTGLAVGPNIFEWVITNTVNCPPSRDTVIITRYAQPAADFAFTNVCFGSANNFINTTNNNGANIASYEWDINNDNMFDYFVPNFSHTYAVPGSYTVCLVVTSTDGCKDTVCKQVQAHPMPVADFNTPFACHGIPVTFNNTSSIPSGQIASYTWNFGDGSPVNNQQTPVHTYANPGLFTVTLTVVSDSGCVDQVVKTIQVYALPIADFYAKNACLYDAVNFFDMTTVQNSVIQTWNWSFSGGAPNNSSQHPSVWFNAPGTYPVSLIVTSLQGCSDTVTKDIVIHPVPVVDFTVGNNCQGDPNAFNNLSSISGGSIASWNWDFGDGFFSSDQNPLHAFQQSGNFVVTLTAVSDSGCVNSESKSLTIWPLPEPNFSLNNTCENDTVVVTNLSNIVSGAIVGWTWSFGDGSPNSNQQHPTHIYASPGPYNVALTLTSDFGCTITLAKLVDIFPAPVVDFIHPGPIEGCAPLCVQLQDNSYVNSMYSSEIRDYLWEFGDGSMITEKDPLHCFQNRGSSANTFGMKLTTTSNLGCKGSAEIENIFTVWPQPTAMFDFDPKRNTILNPTFFFENQSSGESKFSWNLGDGTIDSVRNNISHVYSDTGTYTVTLSVENDWGCTDQISYTVYVQPVFHFYIPNAFSPDGDGLNETFNGKGFGFDKNDPNAFNMKIYDRWGELIYESTDYAKGWDGTNNGTPLKPDAFVYKFYIIDLTNDPHEFRGTVTLVK